MASGQFSRPFSTGSAYDNLRTHDNARHSTHYLDTQAPPPSNHLPEASTASLPSTPFLEKPEDASLGSSSNGRYYGDVAPLPKRRPFYKRPWVWAVGGVVVAAIVALAVYAAASKSSKHGPAGNKSSDNKSSSPNTAGQGSTPAGDKPAPHVAITTGGDGSTVTKEDGTTFTYHNSFGGYCTSSPRSQMRARS